jgi:hypothetical protein
LVVGGLVHPNGVVTSENERGVFVNVKLTVDPITLLTDKELEPLARVIGLVVVRTPLRYQLKGPPPPEAETETVAVLEHWAWDKVAEAQAEVVPEIKQVWPEEQGLGLQASARSYMLFSLIPPQFLHVSEGQGMLHEESGADPREP